MTLEDSVWDTHAWANVSDSVCASSKDSTTWLGWTTIYSYFSEINVSDIQLNIIVLTQEIIKSYDT